MFGIRRKRVQPEGPFYKQRGWINAAVFLTFLVVMSLVGLMAGGQDVHTASSSQEALSGLRGPLSPGDPLRVRSGPGGRPANCGTDDKDTARPTVAPHDVRWKQLDSVLVPTSPSAGPLHTDTGVWWCFAHTPTGALLAAHTIPTQLSGDGWRAVAEQQLVPGDSRDRFVTRKASEGGTDARHGSVGRFMGFSVASYTHDVATVRLLVSNPAGGYLSTSVSLRWRDGDWKVTPRTDGSVYSSVSPTTKTGGFVMWGA